VCEALQYAHAQGVVHRDVKPENILVSRTAQVKVADFGLAKLVAPGPLDRELTGTSQAMGTLHYMAPEQLDSPQQVDHRADIYSVGVVLYELLTGKLPLGLFPPPSQTPGVPSALDAVVARALAREPAQRYQQVGDLNAALATVWPPPPGPWLGDVVAKLAISPPPGVTIPGHALSAANQPFRTSARPRLPVRFLLQATGWFLAAWALACCLWNLGATGLVVAAALMLGAHQIVLRRALRRLPEQARRLTGARGAAQWALSGALFLSGGLVLLFVVPAFQDARALEQANEAYPLWPDWVGKWPLLGGAATQGEWALPPEARQPFTTALGLAPAVGGGPPQLRTRVILARQRPQEGPIGPLTVYLLGALAGLALLTGALWAVLGGRAMLPAGLALTATAFLPWVALLGATPLWLPAPQIGPVLWVLDRLPGHDLALDEVRAWAREDDRLLREGTEWRLNDGMLTPVQARPASLLHRWRLAPGWMGRRRDDLLLVCVSGRFRTQALVLPVTFGPRDGLGRDELVTGLKRRFVRPKMDDHVKKP
jgi:hypothetical protein